MSKKKPEPEQIDVKKIREDDDLVEALRHGDSVPNSELNQLLESWRDDTR